MEAIGQAARAEQDRTQPEDEVADIANHPVKGIDRLVHSPARLVRLFPDELRDVVEGERHRVDHLDDAVVQVPANPVPLVDDRQLLDLLVEAGVLDRDARMQRERLDQRLVIGAELGRTLLVRQVQTPDDLALDSHGNAQERLHRRMFGREAEALGVGGDGRDPIRPVLPDDQPQQPSAAGEVADGLSLLVADPARDELGDQPRLVDNAESGILRGDELADPIDDELQDLPTSSKPLIPRTAASRACRAGGSRASSGASSAVAMS